jgi:hypothetical protein
MKFRLVERFEEENNIEEKLINKLKSMGFEYTYRESG